jgi:limonene-1,2-epoxide hydrolase
MENAKKIVLAFLNALNDENFDIARGLMNDNASFRGVLGSRDGADTYIADMRKMKFKYEILKVFDDATEVCVWYEINMSGQTILTCGWYQLQHDKISHIRVLFDPRPLLEK